MDRRTVVFTLALWAGALAGAGAEAVRVPQRIVSLAPSITETLFAVGAGDRVVGVTDYCEYPPEAAKVEKVGGYLTPSYEALAALRPDLVIVLPEHDDLQPNLEALQLPLLRVDHRTVRGVVHGIRLIGERCGGPKAKALADELDATLAAVDRTLARRRRPRVLVTLGRQAGGTFRSVIGGGPGGLHDDVIARAGGENVLAHAPVPYPSLSAEGLLRLDPDVVVELSAMRDPSDRTREDWSALLSLSAVRKGRVHVFDHDFLSVPGPRFVRFVPELARVLHPDAKWR